MNTNNLPSGLPATAANVANEIEQEWARFSTVTVTCDSKAIEAGLGRLAALRRRNLDSTGALRPATRAGLTFWMRW